MYNVRLLRHVDEWHHALHQAITTLLTLRAGDEPVDEKEQ